MFAATFAYQPIVDIESRRTFAYEALLRGIENQTAAHVLGAVAPGQMHEFDRDARVAAIRLASTLGLSCHLSLNFLPHALDTVADSITATINSASECAIPLQHVILEITEGEIIHDPARFARRIEEFRAQGLRVAIDDFGAGYSGLNLLAEFQPELVKLDMQLVRDIDSKGPRQAIVRAVIQACDDLGIEVIAEGVETEGEYHWFRRRGIRLFQGYYFARPAFRALGEAAYPYPHQLIRDPSTK